MHQRMRHDEHMHVSPADHEDRATAAVDAEGLLDALAGKRLTPDELLDRVLDCEADDPEVVWEVLALLDQYFRRKRIEHDTFIDLKARLQRHSLGSRGDARPMPRQRPGPDTGTGAGTGTGSDGAAKAPRAGGGSRARPGPQLFIPGEPPDATPLPPMHASEPPQPPAPELREAWFHRELRVGDLLCGRYRAVEILRRQEWMTIVEAVDEPKADMPGLRQRVALQVLEESLSQDPLVLQRIGRLQALSHPAITRVLDVEEDDGALVLVTESFTGMSLRDLLDRRQDRRVPLHSAPGIVRTLAGALAHAHARGIAHGDLNASNVLITDLGARLQGFELRAQSHAVQPAADRMAFARLTYELLAGTAEPLTASTPMSLSRLRAPPGITRAQWRALRATLSGRAGSDDDAVLAAFGGEAPAPDETVLLQDTAATPAGRARTPVREWLAASVVAVILGGGIALYLRALPASDQRAAGPPGVVESPLETTSAGPPVVGIPIGEVPAAGIAGTATFIAGTPPPVSRDPVGRIGGGDLAAGGTAAITAAPPPPRTTPARSSIDLSATYAWVDTTEPVARIRVVRQGAMNREVSFRWWTEAGTAQSDRDFRGIEPRISVIPEGSRDIELLVPMMPDPTRREPRTFYVKIDRPSAGTDLGTRTLAQVAIVPPGYPAAGDSRAAQNLSQLP